MAHEVKPGFTDLAPFMDHRAQRGNPVFPTKSKKPLAKARGFLMQAYITCTVSIKKYDAILSH